jgi:hypothetical protein
MRRSNLIGCVVVLALGVTPFLQGESPQPKTRGALDWSAGEWVGTRRDAGSGESVELRLRVEPVLGGAGQAEHLQALHRQGPYLGFTVLMPTEKPGKWSMTYWNSKRTESARLSGDVKATRSTWRTVAPDQPRQSRLLSEQLGRDGWRRTMSISEDGGKSWHVLWVDELQRAR